MIDVHSKALDSKILINRILGKIKGEKPGPTVVFFGGIHGNETAGVFALHDALKQIKAKNVKGIIYGITGNLAALRVNQRYVDEDLNRLWTKDRIDLIHKKENLNTEEKELLEIEKILNKILQTESPPYYFIDLHTTSSKTLPFITINDALINRKFSKQYPVPIILGIEEYLNGPLLSYVNTMGYVSLGFESGQHDELRAVTNTSAFINLTLLFADVLCKTTIEYSVKSFAQLQTQSLNIRDVFEVVYLHRVRAHETFSMNNEFKSFQRVSKGTPLATNNNEIVKAKFTSLIFMPLYQKQGAEGFFLIKPIKPFFFKSVKLFKAY